MNTPETASSPAPRNRSRGLVLDLLTGGGTTLLVGLCLLIPARILPVLAIPAFVCLAFGAALVLAGCLVFPFSKRPVIAG